MKLHQRTLPVQRAEIELEGWLLDWRERHNLTDVEEVRALLAAAQRVSKYMLRAERHPDDDDKGADEE